MIIILISWCCIAYILLNFGVALGYCFKQLEVKFPIVALSLGAFIVMLLTTFTAFFYRINIEFFIVLLISSMLFHLRFKSAIHYNFKILKSNYINLSRLKKVIFWIVFTILLAQSSNAPYLLDNESYYVQTIQWLNEYGLVKGVANLHPFFGQYSGWHLLQSAFNFSFIGQFFNDLNGLFLVIYTLFALHRLEKYQTDKKLPDLIIGLSPIFTVFFIPFTSSPSQDIPIFLISQIILYLFIRHYKKPSKSVYYTILLLVLMLLFIKVTTIVFVLFPIFLFFRNYKRNPSILLPSMLVATITLFLFWSKNYIVTGYPMFPSDHLSFFNPDWSIPEEIQQYNYGYARAYALVTTAEYYESLNFFQKVSAWMQLGKLRGLFNNTMVLLLIIAPFFIWVFKKEKPYRIVYLVGVLQMIFLLSTSAQYRFYFNYYIFFTTFILACIPIIQKKAPILLLCTILIAIVPVFIAIPLNTLTKNKFALDIPSFHYNQLIIPHKNSNFEGVFKKIDNGNVTLNCPVKGKNIHNDVFYWSTGDGELPCTSEEILVFFKEQFGYEPQLRGTTLKEGFKAVKK